MKSIINVSMYRLRRAAMSMTSSGSLSHPALPATFELSSKHGMLNWAKMHSTPPPTVMYPHTVKPPYSCSSYARDLNTGCVRAQNFKHFSHRILLEWKYERKIAKQPSKFCVSGTRGILHGRRSSQLPYLESP
mmetsp:Transcript_8714/g.17685  ORF Transcript_8714/g.17685 Transcript_8714/m.17685 type:complete len:133 (+) Transcript_8714:378-776(+)